MSGYNAGSNAYTLCLRYYKEYITVYQISSFYIHVSRFLL